MSDQTTEPNAETDAEIEDVDKLWDEFDEAEGTTPQTPEEGAAEDGFTSEEPTNTATGEAPEAETTDQEPPAATAPELDWTGVPETHRAAFEKMQADNAALAQKASSANGRYTAAQRRYEDLVKAAQPRTVEGDRPTPGAALAALKEDYPEIAAPLEKAFGAIEGSVAHLAEAEEGRRKAAETELTSYLDEQDAALKAAHPDFLEVLKTNGPKFGEWIEDQPRAMREAFARNANSITDAAGAATVIGAFKTFLRGPAAVPAADVTSQRSDKRQRQLDSAASPTRTSRRPTASGIPEDGDPEAIWDAFEAAEAAAGR